jgi:hypothetical protein
MLIEKTISWTAVAAIVVFSLTQLVSLISAIVKRRRERQHLKTAIYAELNQIVAQSGEASSTRNFNDFVDRCTIERLNAYALPLYNSRLFDSFAERLPSLRSDLVEKIVEAYGLLARMNGLIEHFKSKEFLGADEAAQDSMKGILKNTNFDLHKCVEELLPLLRK